MSNKDDNPENPKKEENLEKKTESEYNYLSDKGQEWRVSLVNGVRRNHLYEFFGTVFMRTLFFAGILLTQYGRESLKDPNIRKMFFDKKYRTGFSEGSIFQNPLYFPNKNGSSLTKLEARAGSWVSYDFKKPSTSKIGGKRKTGKLNSFLLDEIKDNPKELYTPDYTFDWFKFEHVYSLECPSMTYLEEHGLMEQKTYREAYQRMGKYEQYAQAIEVLGIAEKPVFQITPKGNSLIMLLGDGGDKVPKRKEVKKLVLADNKIY